MSSSARSPPRRRFGFDYKKEEEEEEEEEETFFKKYHHMRTRARIFCFFFKKVMSFFFDFRSFPKFQIFTPHTPGTPLLLLERDRETQKARGSIVDTLTPPRFDFFGARGVVFFQNFISLPFGEERIGKRHPRAHTNSAAVLENFQ